MLCILIRWVRSAFHRLPTNWSRVGSSLGRLSQYISAHSAHTWNLLVADDFHLEARGTHDCFCCVSHGGCAAIVVEDQQAGTLSYGSVSKCSIAHSVSAYRKGGQNGFLNGRKPLLLRVTSIWTLSRKDWEGLPMQPVRRVRAPISCTSLSLPHSSSSQETTRRVPAYVSFVLRYLANQLRRQRHYNCESTVLQPENAPRVDAQASQQRTGIGGWRPVEDRNGNIDTRLSPWFSVEIRREDWTWVYERDDKPALVISALEASAILIALKLFYDKYRSEKGDCCSHLDGQPGQRCFT